jgi:RNA polymerase sigma factor (sigma-70 family)
MIEVKTYEKYTDAEVISEILAGKKALYEILIRRNNPYLYKVGRSYGYNHQDTEDLMQETYINAFYALNKFENRAQFKTWITRIMINNCHQKKIKHSYQKEILSDQLTNQNNIAMFQTGTNTQKTFLNKELGHVMENALQQIPETYRMVFTLRELTGLSISETAELLDISPTNVKTRLSRAKSLLKTEIEKMYSAEDIYEFNLVYCDRIVERVMTAITQ